MAKEVIVKGRDAQGGMSKQEETAARKAMETPDTSLATVGGTDVPITEADPETVKAKAEQRKAEEKQAKFVQDQAARSRGAQSGGGAAPTPTRQGQNTAHWKWVRLERGMVPATSYLVQEGDTVREKAATLGRVLDKVQAQSVIALPSSEAKAAIDAKIAVRADDL